MKRLVSDAFKDQPNVQVDLFEPKGAPRPQDMVNKTEKPRMTSGRAAVVKVVSIYREMEYALSKIEIQKLVYFLEEAGHPLKLDFVKHNYGPYSDKLRHVLKAMDGHYITGVGDFSGDSEITIVAGALAEADKFIQASGEKELSERVSRVRELIEGFETPYGMELLATVHWVVTRDSNVHTVEDSIASVQNWNARKCAVLREDHIRLAWRRLKKEGWFLPRRVTTNGGLSFE